MRQWSIFITSLGSSTKKYFPNQILLPKISAKHRSVNVKLPEGKKQNEFLMQKFDFEFDKETNKYFIVFH